VIAELRSHYNHIIYLKVGGEWPNGATPWWPSQKPMQAIFIAMYPRSSGLELSSLPLLYSSLSLSHSLLTYNFLFYLPFLGYFCLWISHFCDSLSIVDMHCLKHSCNTPSLKSTSIMSWTTCKLNVHQHTANNITL
jgi:hypothetical protein